MNENYAALFSVLFSVMATKVQTASVCDKGVTFDKKCYWIDYEKVTWNEALDRCQEVNPKARIAVINDPYLRNKLEELFLKTHLKSCIRKREGCPFIGMHYVNNTWKQIDGKIIPKKAKPGTDDHWYTSNRFWFIGKTLVIKHIKYPMMKEGEEKHCGMLAKYENLPSVSSTFGRGFGVGNTYCFEPSPFMCEVDEKRAHCASNPYSVERVESLCKKGFTIDDKCYWVEHDPKNYTDAKKDCERINRHAQLAIVNTTEIRTRLKKLAEISNCKACFIESQSDKESCEAYVKNGTIYEDVSVSCNEERTYICQVPVSEANHVEPLPNFPDCEKGNDSSCLYTSETLCKNGVLVDEKCYWLETNMLNWFRADARCVNRNRKSRLAKINTPKILESLKKLLAHHSFKHVFMGASDLDREGEWRYLDGTEVTSDQLDKLWYKGRFNGGRVENCAAMRGAGEVELIDANCDTPSPFFCEVPAAEDPRKPFVPAECRASKDDENKRNANPSVCDKGVYLNDTCYWVEYEKVQWREALFQCQKVNADARLAKVNAKDIKEEVKKLFREGDFAACNDKGEECPFIGMNETAEGHWHYVDGTNVTQEEKKSLWFQRPDNGDRRGKCGVFYGKAFNYTLGDADCYIPAPVICQVPFVKEYMGPNRTIPESRCKKGLIIGEKCYWIEQENADFPGAREGCNRQGATLAIFNKENRKYLLHLAEKSGSDILYIGLMKNPNEEHEWKNIDRTVFDLSLFRNKPHANGEKNCGTIDKYEGTYGVADRMCEPKLDYICERQEDNSTRAHPPRPETEQVLCARGIIHRGRCYWIETGKLNWYDAETYCNTLNSHAHLAKINSVDIQNATDKLIPSDWNVENHIYFGANDIDKEGDWRHIDGTKVMLKGTNSGLWKTANFSGREANCAVVLGKGEGGHTFSDVSCYFLRPFMCEVPANKGKWTTPVAKPETIRDANKIVNHRPSICNKGVTVGNKCYWVEHEKVAWGQALIKCQTVNERARLAKVNTELVKEAIERLLIGQSHSDLTECDESGIGCPFIGMNDTAGDGDWRYVDGTKVTENEMHSLWHNKSVATNKQGHRNCGKFLGKSFEYRLGHGRCYKPSKVICEVHILKRRCGPNFDNPPKQSLCQKGITVGDKCYWIESEPKNWTDSQNECKRQNPEARLAIVNNRTTLKHLSDLAEQSYTETMFIGLERHSRTNKSRDGWRNDDGSAFDESLWPEDEPNGGGKQNCGTIFHHYKQGYKLADFGCHEKHSYACQVPVSEADYVQEHTPPAELCEKKKGRKVKGKCYWLENDRTNWFDAEAKCNRRNPNAHLAKVNTEEIRYKIQTLIGNKKSDHVFIATSDIEKKDNWRYFDGTDVTKEQLTELWHIDRAKKLKKNCGAMRGEEEEKNESFWESVRKFFLGFIKKIDYKMLHYLINERCDSNFRFLCEISMNLGAKKPVITKECKFPLDEVASKVATTSVCDEKAVIVDDTCYWIEYEKVSWDEAWQKCQRINPHARLAKVNTKRIWEATKRLLERNKVLNSCDGLEQACPFLGMNDTLVEAHWQYVDGTRITREEFATLWHNISPNGGRAKNCGVILGKGFEHKIGDGHCYRPAPIICQVPYEKGYCPVNPSNLPPKSICHKGKVLGDKCYWVERYAVTWLRAQQECVRHNPHAQLAIVNNRETLNKLLDLAEESYTDIVFIGLARYSETETPTDGWFNIDGSAFNESLWANSEPNREGEENCGTIYQNDETGYGIADYRCHKEHSFACQVPVSKANYVQEHTPPEVLCEKRKGVIVKDKCYWLESDRMNWFDAEAKCNRRNPNAHLAKVNTKEIKEKLETRIGNKKYAQVYMAASDIDKEGDWRYLDETRVTEKQLREIWYRNTVQEFDSDTNDIQDCGAFRGDENTEWKNWNGHPRDSHDLTDTQCHRILRFFCEISMKAGLEEPEHVSFKECER